MEDIFPERINRKDCTELLRKNELILMHETANMFTKIIDDSVESLKSEILLEFPKALPAEHRISIAKELLERFAVLYIENENGSYNSTKLTEDPSGINKNIKAVTIEL